MAVDELRKSEMMDHLVEALGRGEDVGHYGRLVFTMVARYFMDRDEVIKYLRKNPGFSEEDAERMYDEVDAHGYNPPRRDRVLEWQNQQDFEICPSPDDPDSCNVYRDLRFPDEVYESIAEYVEQKQEAREQNR